MRILFISYAFPPFNTVGALRTGKVAESLTRLGHDVRVLTAQDQPYCADLTCELAPEKIFSAPSFNLNFLAERIHGGREVVKAEGWNSALSGRWKVIRPLAEKTYRSFFHLPDPQGGWYFPALKKARGLLKEWKPDAIYASCSPFTSLLIARKLSIEFEIPWFAEFRDLWAYNPYDSVFQLRRATNRWLERKILENCTGVVVVNDSMKELVTRCYGLPCVSIPNGFDEPKARVEKEQAPDGFSPDKLNLVYTGQIYLGARDPEKLFSALQLDRKLEVKIHFYGRNTEVIRGLAEARGISRHVVLHGSVSHSESLAAQRAADVLLFVIPKLDIAREEVSAKFYEYLAAGKKILGVGPKDTAVAKLISRLNVGFASDAPEELCTFLRAFVREKSETKRISYTAPDNLQEFSRKRQNRRLEEWLSQRMRPTEQGDHQ